MPAAILDKSSCLPKVIAKDLGKAQWADSKDKGLANK